MKTVAFLSLEMLLLVPGRMCIAGGGPPRPAPETVKPRAVEKPDAISEAVRNAVKSLEKAGLAIDTNAAARSAVMAIATTIDRGAKIVPLDSSQITDREDDTVSTNTVRWDPTGPVEALPKGLSYVRINGMYVGAGTSVVDRICGAVTGGIGGLILDLRGAGGRGLDCVTGVAGLFTGDSRSLFAVRAPDGTELERMCAVKRQRLGIPAVALIDGNTTGAAEVFAAVVKGLPGILVVGRTTRGESQIREKVAVSD